MLVKEATGVRQVTLTHHQQRIKYSLLTIIGGFNDRNFLLIYKNVMINPQ